MGEQSDLELVLASQQGDKSAFGQLTVRYQPMAQRLATRVTGQRDLAQELVQESFLQAYLSLSKLSDPKRFRSWLYGIVLNTCRNEWRRRKIISFSLETMVGSPASREAVLSDSSLDPQKIIEQKEVNAIVYSAMNTLSEKNRSALLLFYKEQLSVREVADRLDISTNAVKGRLHKARQQLKNELLPMQTILFPESKSMANATTMPNRTELRCSFCGKSNQQVSSLIAGPLLGDTRIYICNECVESCNKILKGETPPLTQEEVEKLIL